MRKMNIDFDGVMINHLKRVAELYNRDYALKKGFKEINWQDINTYNMDEMTMCTIKERLEYFGDKRFFEELELASDFKRVIAKLNESGRYTFAVVTMGIASNLEYKREFIPKALRDIGINAELILLDMDKHKDKSSIDMTDSIFIDDLGSNLETSNAKIKILFGDKKQWNESYRGIRLHNWDEIYEYLEG